MMQQMDLETEIEEMKDKLIRAMKEANTAAPESWAEVLADPTIALLEGLSKIAPPPLNIALVPLSLVVGEVVRAVQRARGNKEGARNLAKQALDVSLKLQEVVAIIKDLPDDHDQVKVG